MATTSLSLLERIKASSSEDLEPWQVLQAIYTPFIEQQILRYRQSLTHLSDDIVQDVMLVVMSEIHDFERQRDGSFRCWLRTITINRIRNLARAKQRESESDAETTAWLNNLADPSSLLTQQWNADHNQHVLKTILTQLQGRVQPKTWQVFEAYVLQDETVSSVADQFSVSEADIYSIKSRMLRLAREASAGLIDEVD